MSISSLNSSSIISPFVFPFILYKPCSFKDSDIFNAWARIVVLNALLPVKYNIANGNSVGDEYNKSIRLKNLSLPGNLPIAIDFALPLLNNSVIIFFSNNALIKVEYTVLSLFLSEIIISMSPDDLTPLL